ncbi:unnamed protein product [Ambrosiozyma monospora]|uniref:Unnamed protein product n=1 Tax=Ambrosiozyma monospora TaxID=43982 RepID=A0ACB5TE06_AMBMO|nr:unnamed protein product [Ambrosiozyma monospora]
MSKKKIIRLGGVGKALIQTCYDFADKHDNIDRVYWKTEMSNHRAQLLYRKVGKFEGFVTYRRPQEGETVDDQ